MTAIYKTAIYKTGIHKVGIIGGRGHTGRVLLGLIAGHSGLQLCYASSREFAGKPVADVAPELLDDELNEVVNFEALTPEDVASRAVDLVILALPDGVGEPYVKAILAQDDQTKIIDLSADYRFSDDWVYGLPELLRLKGDVTQLRGAKKIANPGCYATAMQLSIAPLTEHIISPPSIFGVSGYSGAGTTPSPRNNPEQLRDNLMPYKLTGHNHEREASHHLGRDVYFTPHVHPTFSGIVTTVHLMFNQSMSHNQLFEIFQQAYGHEPLISVLHEPPELKQGTNENGILIGGFAVSENGHHGVIVAAEDNLRKGAGVQALQNINLALGFDEFTAIEPKSP